MFYKLIKFYFTNQPYSSDCLLVNGIKPNYTPFVEISQ